jgi:hypothetical protein
MPLKQSEIRAWEPSPLEEQKYAIEDSLRGVGSWAQKYKIPFLRALDDPYYTRNVAENLSLGTEMIPGLGDIQGIREGQHITEQGHPFMGSLMMGASLVPFVPGSALARLAARKGIDIDAINKRWSELQEQQTRVSGKLAEAESYQKSGHYGGGPADFREGVSRQRRAQSEMREIESEMDKIAKQVDDVEGQLDLEFNKGGEVYQPLMNLKY